jgi:integrase
MKLSNLPKGIRIRHGWYVLRKWDKRARTYAPQIRLAPKDAHYGEVMDAYNRITAKQIYNLRSLATKYFESKQFLDLSPTTQNNYQSYIVTIDRTKFTSKQSLLDIPFNKWSLGLARQYLDLNESSRPIAGNREIQFMRSVFSWGHNRDLCPTNPIRGIRLKHSKRDRYIEDWEYKLVLNLAEPRMKAFITIAYKCRLRPQEVRNLKNEHKLEEGLLCTRDKGSKNTIVEWDDELKEVVSWSNTISPYIVHDGKGYYWKKNSFDSAWRRLMNLAIKSGLKKKFTAHDLKAKGISDDEGNAQLGAGHIDGRVTESVYRRKPATVSPITLRHEHGTGRKR